MIVVPLPGIARISSAPPSAWARWRIVLSPRPGRGFASGSKPTPLSDTIIAYSSPEVSISISTRVAPACFTTLFSASAAMRSSVISTSGAGRSAWLVALTPTSTATTVRVVNGETVTTDGPFAETKEQLGGFYLIEAKDLNDAIQVASRIPSVKTGSIEVRPIMVFNRPA